MGFRPRPPARRFGGGGMRLALCHLRRNCTYGELAQDNGMSPSTAWFYVQLMTEFLAEVLGRSDEDLRVAVSGKVCLVDGSLVPAFNWRHRRDLYSGKHRKAGVNVQAIVDVHGRLVGTSHAFPGSRHDSWCFEESGFVDILASSGGGIGDSGYQGSDLISPIKKKPGTDSFGSRHRVQHRPGEDLSGSGMGLRAPQELADSGESVSRRPAPHRPGDPGHHRPVDPQRTTHRPHADLSTRTDRPNFRMTSLCPVMSRSGSGSLAPTTLARWTSS